MDKTMRDYPEELELVERAEYGCLPDILSIFEIAKLTYPDCPKKNERLWRSLHRSIENGKLPIAPQGDRYTRTHKNFPVNSLVLHTDMQRWLKQNWEGETPPLLQKWFDTCCYNKNWDLHLVSTGF